MARARRLPDQCLALLEKAMTVHEMNPRQRDELKAAAELDDIVEYLFEHQSWLAMELADALLLLAPDMCDRHMPVLTSRRREFIEEAVKASKAWDEAHERHMNAPIPIVKHRDDDVPL
jgi:hypothetical protein